MNISDILSKDFQLDINEEKYWEFKYNKVRFEATMQGF